MEHLGDITKIDGGKIEPVHVLTFGSPCQNLSLIGNRSGLAGAKSSLFYQAFRIVHEMRGSLKLTPAELMAFLNDPKNAFSASGQAGPKSEDTGKEENAHEEN